jgi:hypothetical protein
MREQNWKPASRKPLRVPLAAEAPLRKARARKASAKMDAVGRLLEEYPKPSRLVAPMPRDHTSESATIATRKPVLE